MEVNGSSIDNVREELKKSNAEIDRLSNYVDVLNSEKEKLLKTFNDKIERKNTNFKILEGQYESAVSDKFNIKRQLEQLKDQNVALQRKVDLFEEQKKKIADKWNLLNSHEMAMKVLKSKFEEQLSEFLNDYGSGNDDHQSTNESDQIPSTEDSLNESQIGVPAGGIKTEVIMEAQNDLMENNGDRNYHFHPMETSVHGTSSLSMSSCYVSMRRTSGTTIQRVSRLSSTTKVTSTKTVITQNLPVVALCRNIKDKLNSMEVVPNRPRRHLTCTLCSKRYTSGPGNAFCMCVKGPF